MTVKWNEMKVRDKILAVTKVIILLCFFILGLFHFWGKIENTRSTIVPLAGIYLIILAFQNWNKDRDSASIYVIMAIIAMIISLSIWIG